MGVVYLLGQSTSTHIAERTVNMQVRRKVMNVLNRASIKLKMNYSVLMGTLVSPPAVLTI